MNLIDKGCSSETNELIVITNGIHKLVTEQSYLVGVPAFRVRVPHAEVA